MFKRSMFKRLAPRQFSQRGYGGVLGRTPKKPSSDAPKRPAPTLPPPMQPEALDEVTEDMIEEMAVPDTELMDMLNKVNRRPLDSIRGGEFEYDPFEAELERMGGFGDNKGRPDMQFSQDLLAPMTLEVEEDLGGLLNADQIMAIFTLRRLNPERWTEEVLAVEFNVHRDTIASAVEHCVIPFVVPEEVENAPVGWCFWERPDQQHYIMGFQRVFGQMMDRSEGKKRPLGSLGPDKLLPGSG